jgi:hypothetical protein
MTPGGGQAERSAGVGTKSRRDGVYKGEHVVTRFWLAAPAVFALTIGGALAQTDTTISTRTRTTVPAPAIGSYSATETQKTTDGMGSVTSKTQTYKSGVGGTDTTATTHTVTPGGRQTKTMEQTATPYGTATTKKSTTTTA